MIINDFQTLVTSVTRYVTRMLQIVDTLEPAAKAACRAFSYYYYYLVTKYNNNKYTQPFSLSSSLFISLTISLCFCVTVTKANNSLIHQQVKVLQRYVTM